MAGTRQQCDVVETVVVEGFRVWVCWWAPEAEEGSLPPLQSWWPEEIWADVNWTVHALAGEASRARFDRVLYLGSV